jgi:AmmeMemoRadiSam system protein B
MSNGTLLPSIRPEILAEVYKEEGREYVYLTDPEKYATQAVSIPSDFLPLLAFLDGNYEIARVEQEISRTNKPENVKEIMDSFVNLINFLDYMGYLQSQRFNWLKQDIDTYMNSTVRPAYCSGSSYAEKTSELEREMEEIFSAADKNSVKAGARMIIVPHIDFRIGRQAHTAYAMGYHALRDKHPDLIVIFGTSHNGSSKRFILSEKHFETPFGVVQNATDLTNSLLEYANEDDEIIIDELAHRNEHSIEFQVLLSQYYFKNKPFKILPVLVNSFVGDIYNGILPADDEKFLRFIDTLKKIINESDYEPVYIASVDLAHIGRKFDDDFDAEDKLEQLKKEDENLIRYIEQCDADSFFKSVADIKDRNKICGLAPIYSILKLIKPSAADYLYYDIWSEKETKSAVSFSAFAFY